MKYVNHEIKSFLTNSIMAEQLPKARIYLLLRPKRIDNEYTVRSQKLKC